MKYLKTFERKVITKYWKFYPINETVVEIAIFKLGLHCRILDWLNQKHVWIYEEVGRYGWDNSRVDPIKSYPNENLLYMGEYKITEEDIEKFEIEKNIKKYNL